MSSAEISKIRFSIKTQSCGFRKVPIARILVGQRRMRFPSSRDETFERLVHPDRFEIARSTEWIQEILRAAESHGANIVVLPELTVPAGVVELIRTWSVAHEDVVIVAGSHYQISEPGARLLTNCCPVIYAGQMRLTEKLEPSLYEKKQPDPRFGSEMHYVVQPGRRIYVFTDTPVGNMAAVICSDALKTPILNELFQYKISLLCVLSLQGNSIEWHHRTLSTECRNHEDGLFIAYANSTVYKETDSGHDVMVADGKSSFFGIVHRAFGSGEKRLELPEGARYFVVEVNTNATRPPANVVSTDSCNIIVEPIESPRDISAEQRKYKAIIFDIDGPIIRHKKSQKQSSWHWVYDMLGNGIQETEDDKTQYLKGQNEYQYKDWIKDDLFRFKTNKLKRQQLYELSKQLELTDGIIDVLKYLKNSGVKIFAVSDGIDALLYDLLPEADGLFDQIWINRFYWNSLGVIHHIEPTPYHFDNKVEALHRICNEYGFDEHEVIVVGDDSNDIAILKNAGLGFAYETSSQELLRFGKRLKKGELPQLLEYFNRHHVEKMRLLFDRSNTWQRAARCAERIDTISWNDLSWWCAESEGLEAYRKKLKKMDCSSISRIFCLRAETILREWERLIDVLEVQEHEGVAWGLTVIETHVPRTDAAVDQSVLRDFAIVDRGKWCYFFTGSTFSDRDIRIIKNDSTEAEYISKFRRMHAELIPECLVANRRFLTTIIDAFDTPRDFGQIIQYGDQTRAKRNIAFVGRRTENEWIPLIASGSSDISARIKVLRDVLNHGGLSDCKLDVH